MKNRILPGFKKMGVLWAAALIPLLWDLFKMALVYLSRYLGYNFFLDGNFGGITLMFPESSLRVFLPSLLPSIQQMNLLKDFKIGSGAFNNTWMGHTAYGAYLFLAGLMTGGYLGILKDIIRGKHVHIKAFLQFAWYYGPRFFLVFIFQHLFVTVMTVFFGMPKGGLLACLVGMVFVWTPYIIIMEDFGIIEAAVLAPIKIIRHFKSSVLFLLQVCLVSTLFLIGISQLESYKWLFGLIIWPFMGTCLIYDMMLFFEAQLTEEPLEDRPRECLHGYGQTIFKTVLLLVILMVIFGLPTIVSKQRYFSAMLPWHEPAIELKCYVYQTQGGAVMSKQNRFKSGKLVIDFISPPKSVILKKAPDIIRGRGRLLTDYRPIYFNFELSRGSDGENGTYSLNSGGMIQATDGIWGNPVDRGMVLAVSGDLSLFSGIVFDKSNYPDFDTIWSEEKDCIFLGPAKRMPDIYGFYAGSDIPETAIQFQWKYNSILNMAYEWEKDPIQAMECLDLAFVTLDSDLLLEKLYYVSDIEPDNVLQIIKDRFSRIKADMEAAGFANWEKNIRSQVGCYPVNDQKVILAGSYSYLEEILGFRAELFKIGSKWKMTRIQIMTD